MRLSTLLLSSAALVASGTVGFAADLPSKKAAPVEYVRVCSQFGAGFFYVPGSDTCLRVFGRVRAEVRYNDGANTPYTRGANFTTFRARGYLALDSYTATDWGPVRATTRVFVTRDSGRGGAGGAKISNGDATTDANVTLDWAYVQFAGITAGRLAVSFFDFAPFGGLSYIGGGQNGRGSDLGSVNALAYTASFGGGFSATLALEDGTERRGLLYSAGADYMNTGALLSGSYAGNAMPDVVGRLDYSGSWGLAALTGAVHQSRSNNLYTGSGTSTFGDTEYGFAVQGGVKINLPMLAPGDAMFLQAAYANGANSYTGWSGVSVGSISPGIPGFGFAPGDVIYDASGNGHLTQSWSVAGGLLHFWTPTVRQSVTAAYGSVNPYGSLYDMSIFSVATQLIWSPVRGLDIGGEFGYAVSTNSPQVFNTPANIAAGSLYGLSKDNYFARLRFQRDF